MKLIPLALAMTLVTTAATASAGHGCKGHKYNKHHRHHAHHQHHHAHSGHKQYRYDGHYDRRANYRWGRVTYVEPIYTRRISHYDNQSCLSHRDYRRRDSSQTPMLLGAVVGTAIGHRLGDSYGDPGIAAVAGGLLGASIGRDMGRKSDYRRNLEVRGPCGRDYSRHDRHDRPELAGYLVRYEYAGRHYQERMEYDPGKWVKLNGNVRPI